MIAATRIVSIYITKGKSIAQTISDRTDYALNPEKTSGGELVSSYTCDPKTLDAEFVLSKRQYRYSLERKR